MDKIISRFGDIQKFQKALGDYPSLAIAIKNSGIRSELVMGDIFDKLVGKQEYLKSERKELIEHLLQQAQK